MTQIESKVSGTRILAVDLGLSRTGLALSDEQRLSTRALPDRLPKSRAEDIGYLLTLCDEMDIGTILIGYPLLPQSGQEGMMAKRARGFYEALKSSAQKRFLELAIFLVDESYTSREAEKRLALSGMKKSHRQNALDGEAARILIEEFLAANRS